MYNICNMEKNTLKKGAKKKEQAKPKKSDAKPEKAEKKKTGLKVAVALGVVVMIVGGMFGVRTYLGRTIETEEKVQVSDDTRSFSGFFREYLADRVAAENLMSYGFREKNTEEILDELTKLKDGFAKVSRGMNGFEDESAFAKIAKVMKDDATVYLKLVRELRAVETGEYAEEADRQVQFIKVADEGREGLRSRLYVSRSAYDDDPGKLTGESVLLFSGVTLAEVGGGVMNIYVGNVENNATVVTGGDFASGAAQAIAAEELYGYTAARMVKLGAGVKAELETGRLKAIDVAELNTSEATVHKLTTGLAGKTVWKLGEITEKYGADVLILKEEKGMSQILTETEEAIRGKKKSGEE